MQSFGLLKPDCGKRHLTQAIINEINNSDGLTIIKKKLVMLKPYEVGVIWSPCVGQPFYPQMLKFSISNSCLIFIVEGNDAINVLNDLVGCYDPDKAKSYTLRHRFGKNKMENIIHSSSDEENFIKERDLFF